MQGETNTHLRLPAVLDLAASEAFLDTMRHACEAETVMVDASGVDVLTSPCIQVILAALKINPGVRIESPSDAFVQAFADLALEWRQDGQEDAQQAAQQSAPPAAPLSAEEEAEAAFHAAAQQYSQLDSEPADGSSGQADSQLDMSVSPAGAPEDDINTIANTQTGEACMTKRILTIDDSRTIRDMLNLTLSEAGFEVLQAVDGQDGIDVLEKEQVDLVITDINMPKMDGYGVIRHIRGQSQYNGMPVLVLTTESEKDKRNVAREAGATGWMVKPFDPERLIAAINKVAP
jgi:two-component system, chemotaxis family, chemotaxis protein CheY